MKIDQSASSSYLLQLLEAADNSQTTATSGATQSTSTSSGISATATGDSSSVSNPAQLFKELEQLSSSNPAEFKKISASIAQQLTAAAKNSTDAGQAAALNSLAANFTKASSTGNFSDLFSQPNGNGGTPGISPPPATHGADAYADSSSSNDPLEKIFAQALQQIQTDLKGTSSSTTG